MDVSALDVILVHISPVLRIPQVGWFAAVGKPGLLNAGAAIAAMTIGKKSHAEKTRHSKLNLSDQFQFISIKVVLQDSGEMLFWMDDSAAKSLLYVLHDSKQIEDVKCRTVSDIKFLVVKIPSEEPRALEFLFNNT